MKRLIDADELYVDARFGENEEPYISLYQINDAPTVDAVPVVRCKDCEYIESKFTWYCWRRQNIVNADDFCSWGERRDDKTD